MAAIAGERYAQKREESAVDVVATWTGQLAHDLRDAGRQTIDDFAARLGITPRGVSKWEANPDGVLANTTQQLLDTALAQADAETRSRFAVLRSDRRHPVAGGSVAPAARTAMPGDQVAAWAEEADAELAGLTGGPGQDAVATLWDEAAEVARAGNRTAFAGFTAAARVRQLALTLAAQTRRPPVLADLYVVTGQSTALMASAAFDLGQWDESAVLARSAVAYARSVGDPSLTAWTLGLAALLANWRGEPGTALAHFRRGMEVAPAGTPRVRLRCIAARSHALLGDADSVRELLTQARRDQDEAGRHHDRLSVETGGEFAFGPARAGACAAAAWLDLGLGAAARDAARGALDELEALPAATRSFSQVAGARIDLATACLADGELDEAGEALSGVLAVPPQLRNMSLTGRLSRTRTVLVSSRWAGDTAAGRLNEAIGEWLAGRS